MKTGTVLFSICAAMAVVPSCGSRQPAQDEHSFRYEDCFNGRLLIEEDGLFGIAEASDSSVLLLPSYEELAFISDDMSLGCRDGQWSLMDRDGHVIASSFDRDYLLGEAVELFEKAMADGEKNWNEILDLYDELCNACLDERTSTSDRLRLLNEMEEKTDAATGTMSEEQKARFEHIKERHKEFRR